MSRRCGLFWWVALLLPFIVFPGIDLTVSGWFAQGAAGFPFHDSTLGRIVLKGLPPVLIALAVGAVALAAYGRWKGRVVAGVTPAVAAYLALSLALGPGLLVNTVFKDHWHRARPSQIVEFGGSLHFTPVLQLADQCATNCSFSSGHGALGFWPVALALLAPLSRRRAAVAAALAFGAFVGMVRIAQGGHFLSDVVFSALLTISLALVLRQWLLAGRKKA
jgi:lipid A 4'-phosphatase